MAKKKAEETPPENAGETSENAGETSENAGETSENAGETSENKQRCSGYAGRCLFDAVQSDGLCASCARLAAPA